MPTPPRLLRACRTAAVALGAAGLVALGPTPDAVTTTGKDAPHVVMGKIAPVRGLRPGSTFHVPVVVANKGTTTLDKVWLFYSATRGLDYADVPSNCQEFQVPTSDDLPVQVNVLCRFDQPVKPGVSYTPTKPLVIKALDHAYTDDLRVSVSATDPGYGDNFRPPVTGTAPAVELVGSPPVDPVPPGVGGYPDDSVLVPVTTVNTADYRVTGARLRGRVGDTVTLKVSFTNTGPAWVVRPDRAPYFHVFVTPPAGTSIVRSDCVAAKGGVSACGPPELWVNEGEEDTFTFKLRIDKRVAGARGSVTMSTEARPFDHDRADDRAAITLPWTGDGQLADTGASGAPLPLAGAAASAVAVGTGALLLARRRRRERGRS